MKKEKGGGGWEENLVIPKMKAQKTKNKNKNKKPLDIEATRYCLSVCMSEARM